MRTVCVVALVVAQAAGGGPSRRPIMSYTPNLGLQKRDAMVRSLYLRHPDWTTEEVAAALQARLQTAGLKPMGFEMLRQQLIRIRKELNVQRTWEKMSDEHSTFLRSEFSADRTQPASAVWAKFQTRWGPDAVPGHRVTRWWHNMVRQCQHRNTGVTSPRPRSSVSAPSDASPPQVSIDWWDLGVEFDQYITSDVGGTVAPLSAQSRPDQANIEWMEYKEACDEFLRGFVSNGIDQITPFNAEWSPNE